MQYSSKVKAGTNKMWLKSEREREREQSLQKRYDEKMERNDIRGES